MQTKARRARGHAKSPYAKRNKKEYRYPFPTGKQHADSFNVEGKVKK
jgi:hypothetical protein